MKAATFKESRRVLNHRRHWSAFAEMINLQTHLSSGATATQAAICWDILSNGMLSSWANGSNVQGGLRRLDMTCDLVTLKGVPCCLPIQTTLRALRLGRILGLCGEHCLFSPPTEPWLWMLTPRVSSQLWPDVAPLPVTNCSLLCPESRADNEEEAQGRRCAPSMPKPLRNESSLRACASAPCLCQVSDFIMGLREDQLQSTLSLGQGRSSLPKLRRAWLAALQRLATAVELVRLWAFLRTYPPQHVHILKSRDLLGIDSFFYGVF